MPLRPIARRQSWDYGFVELFDGARDAVNCSARISNPGCYPTGFLALRRPLVEAGIIAPGCRAGCACRLRLQRWRQGHDREIPAGEMPPHGAYGMALAHKHVPEMTLCRAGQRADLHAVGQSPMPACWCICRFTPRSWPRRDRGGHSGCLRRGSRTALYSHGHV